MEHSKSKANSLNTPQAHFSRLGNLLLRLLDAMSPEQSGAISEQAAFYIQTLRQKRRN